MRRPMEQLLLACGRGFEEIARHRLTQGRPRLVARAFLRALIAAFQDSLIDVLAHAEALCRTRAREREWQPLAVRPADVFLSGLHHTAPERLLMPCRRLDTVGKILPLFLRIEFTRFLDFKLAFHIAESACP